MTPGQQAVWTALAVPLTANGEVIGVMTFIDGPARLFEADDRIAGHRGGEHGRALPSRARPGSNASTWWPRSSNGLCCPTRCLRLTACVSTPSTEPEWPEAMPVVTGTTYSSWETIPSSSAWATSWSRVPRPAAALMGQVRSAIRAYAVSGQSPTEVLSSLDLLFNTLVEDRVVTAVVGTISPSTGRVVLSNAGHPPPLVVRSDGTVMFCPLQHSLLIAAGLNGTPRPRDEMVLDQGDSLIMYSDGLIERRGELITNGMERLGSTATAIAKSGWPDNAAVTFASMLSNEERTDDVVVLCINYLGSEERRLTPQPVGNSRDGMATLRTWNPWRRALRSLGTGSPRTCVTCRPMSRVAPPC